MLTSLVGFRCNELKWASAWLPSSNISDIQSQNKLIIQFLIKLSVSISILSCGLRNSSSRTRGKSISQRVEIVLLISSISLIIKFYANFNSNCKIPSVTLKKHNNFSREFISVISLLWRFIVYRRFMYGHPFWFLLSSASHICVIVHA